VIVIDTNVVSELMKPKPDLPVTTWVLSKASTDLFMTSITLAEILYGIERLPNGKRKALLRSTAADVFATFADHVLPFDTGAATAYATIVDARDRRGLPIDGFDAQIASICRARGAGLATRNVKDFEHTGIQVYDPWHRGEPTSSPPLSR